jgi:putative transposase
LGVIIMARKALKIKFKKGQKKELTRIVNGHKSEQRMVLRAKVILLAGEGKTREQISEETGLSPQNVGKWRNRFTEKGIEGLIDASGRGRKPQISPEKQAKIISLACTKPDNGKVRRSQREIAKEAEVSQSRVSDILARTDLRPHKTEYWCGKSPDPEFEAKQAQIIGLYMNPPENVLVISIDEKTQIQALGRTQKELPASQGKPRKLTATYKRNGTACLLAALLVHSGDIEGKCVEKNNHETFLEFLDELYIKYGDKELCLIADNLAVHKHEKVKIWLKKHKNVKIFYTPTYSSWINQIEIWFGIFTRDVLKDGVWDSKYELVESIVKYIKYYNDKKAKPFKWTYTGKVLTK